MDLGFGISFKERFRFSDINTPEIHGVKNNTEEYKSGLKAKNRVCELIEGKKVIIQTKKDKKGKYGRYIADIFIENRNLGDILIEEKLAVKYKYK